MSLINCPECGENVSDKAGECPHCGYKLSKKINGQIDVDVSNKKCKSMKTPMIITVIICIIAVAVVLIILKNKGAADENESSQTSVNVSQETEMVKEIDSNINYVATIYSEFNSQKIKELANERISYNFNYFSGSTVPIPTSCVNGMVEFSNEDGNYGYYFGSGADAKNEDMYLSGVCAYSAVLHHLGFDFDFHGSGEVSYITKDGKQKAAFMVFETTEDGYVFMITPL